MPTTKNPRKGHLSPVSIAAITLSSIFVCGLFICLYLLYSQRRFPFHKRPLRASELAAAAAAAKLTPAHSPVCDAEVKSSTRSSTIFNEHYNKGAISHPCELNEVDATHKVELPADNYIHEMHGTVAWPAQELDGTPIAFERPRQAPRPPRKPWLSPPNGPLAPLQPTSFFGRNTPPDSPMFFRHIPPSPPPATPTTTVYPSRTTSLLSPKATVPVRTASPPRRPTPPPKSPRDYSTSPSSSRRSPFPFPRTAVSRSPSPTPQRLRPRPPPKNADERQDDSWPTRADDTRGWEARSPTPPLKGS